MFGHGKDCTYYNNGVTLCLDCDEPIEIDWMCVHSVHKPEKLAHTCKPKGTGGKHRQEKKKK